jgi:dTMP kinase
VSARGRFITLEGGEGVGKSTLAGALTSQLEARGVNVVRTREPGGSPGAEALRKLILSPPDGADGWLPTAEAMLFYAARSDHLDRTIRPALARGEWVICDRFSDSTRAYQVAAGGVAPEHIDALEHVCVGPTAPDLTLVLDLPMAIARTRMTARGGGPDAIESRSIAYHEAVYRAFLDIARANPQRCVVLDASSAPDAVAHAAMTEIGRRFAEVR